MRFKFPMPILVLGLLLLLVLGLFSFLSTNTFGEALGIDKTRHIVDCNIAIGNYLGSDPEIRSTNCVRTDQACMMCNPFSTLSFTDRGDYIFSSSDCEFKGAYAVKEDPTNIFNIGGLPMGFTGKSDGSFCVRDVDHEIEVTIRGDDGIIKDASTIVIGGQ
jgi:hypothetical protein